MRNKWSGRPLAARGRRPTAANSATARVIGMRQLAGDDRSLVTLARPSGLRDLLCFGREIRH